VGPMVFVQTRSLISRNVLRDPLIAAHFNGTPRCSLGCSIGLNRLVRALHPRFGPKTSAPCAITQLWRYRMQRRDINAADAPAPAGQYTQAVEVTGATRTLYLSGQVGVAADGSIPGDAEAQCALACRNLQAQLRAAGMEITNLVKITTIVRDPADTVAVRTGRRRSSARTGRPARSSLAVSAIRRGRSRWRALRSRDPAWVSSGSSVRNWWRPPGDLNLHAMCTLNRHMGLRRSWRSCVVIGQ
jgi:2-iminobutanoate/2-iminopropanoate deaminase